MEVRFCNVEYLVEAKNAKEASEKAQNGETIEEWSDETDYTINDRVVQSVARKPKE
jgi:hypothetical protein